MSALKKFKLELKEKREKEFKLLKKKSTGSKRELNQKLLISTNPFEKKFSKQKFEIVNKKSLKANMLPRPGKKRLEEFGRKRDTLRMELANRGRENVMLDKRFGENDPTMSVEDKMLVRFMKEKAAASAHSSRGTDFNLNDDDDNNFNLTHMGQSLALEDMDDDAFTASGLQPVDYDDDDGGNIDADVVKFAHFGGFEADEKDQSNPMHKKSRNEIMKEIIQKSKMHKRERQMQKEQDLELVEQVDADLDEIRGLLAPMADTAPASHGKMVVSSDRLRMIQGLDPLPPQTNTTTVQVEEKKSDNDYDKLFRELARDGRAAPTDRTKTEEELAAEEAESLRKAEEKRVKRMQGIASDDSDDEAQSSKKRGKSSSTASSSKKKTDPRDAIADDLGDDMYREGLGQRIAQEEIMPLTYNKEGVLVNNEIFMKPKDEGSSDEDGRDSSEEESDESSDGDEESESESGDESENVKEKVELIGSMEPDFDDNLSGQSGEPEFESEGEEIVDEDQAALEEMYEKEKENSDSDSEEESLPEPKKRKVSKEVMESASKELPYTFEAPQTFDDFKELIKGRSGEDQITIVKRLLILYSVKINGKNSVHMENLSCILMERIIELGNSKHLDMDLIKNYREHAVELCRLYPNAFAKWCKSEIQKLRDTFNSRSKAAFPGPGHLIMFKEFARIFSVSDMHHQVMTPVMLLLGQFLSQAPVSSLKDALVGIALCQIFHSYTIESKRYVPEVVSFLHLMLVQCLSECKGLKAPKYLSTVRKCAPGLLAIQDFSLDFSTLSLSEMYNSASKSSKNQGPLRLVVLHESISLLTKFCKLWNDTCSIIEVFGSTMDLIRLIPSTANPKLMEQVSGATRVIGPLLESAKLKRRPLQLQKRKAMPIKTFVPKFHTSYSIDKRYDPDHQRAQEGKLKAEYKKEFKGAVRELRKDAAFLVREKLDKMKKSDQEYKKKMDKIVGQLAEQEGAMRGYEKAAKKK